MNAKITRFEAKRDTEAIEWAKELRETENWFQSQRFRQITRLHTAYEVVALRGTAREEHYCHAVGYQDVRSPPAVIQSEKTGNHLWSRPRSGSGCN